MEVEHEGFEAGERVIVTIDVMRIRALEEAKVIRVYAREGSRPGLHYVLVEASEGRRAVVGESRLERVERPER